MSKSNEAGTQLNPGQEQVNPEQERDVNGDGVVTNHAGFPVPVKIEEEHGDQDQNHVSPLDAESSAVAKNGVNGVHPHPSQEDVHADDCIEDVLIEDVGADGDAQEESTGENGDEAIAESHASTPENEVAPPANEIRTPRSAVKIKGRPGGVSLELGEGDWDEMMLLLEERLQAAEGFFRGGRVLLEVGTRALVEENLRQVRDLLENHEMHLAVVRSTAERTLQAAAEVGISTTIEEIQESLHVPEPPLIIEDGPPNAYTPSSYAPPPEVVTGRPNHFVHRGSLRSGQVLRKTESIVVIGDVNPGAQVISGGDVMIWGRLRGIAHAGAEGNRRAVVAAIDFVPTQLRIANLTAIAPERTKPRSRGLFFWKKEPERGPEIARVIDGRIVVEPWDEGKPNGLGMWRNK